MAESSSQPWLFNESGDKDKTCWETDRNMTSYARQLLAAKPIHDDLAQKAELYIYDLNICLHEPERRNTKLFVRKHAREVWDEVLQHDYDKSAVIGSPGIGKSWSSAFYVKKLLENKKLVAYEARQSNAVYMFVPPGKDNGNEEYVAYRTSIQSWDPNSCPALQSIETYYYIDPGRAESSADIPLLSAHTAVGPSPEPQHLGEWGKRARFFYLGPWSYEDILVVRPHMPVSSSVLDELQVLDEQEVSAAFRRYGGILRHIFAPTDSKNLADQRANRVLQDKELVKGIYKVGTEFLNTKDRSKPPSALFTLVPVRSIEEAGEAFHRKPQDFRPFAEARVAVVSEWAREALVEQYWADLERLVACKSPEQAVSVGWLFEDAAHVALARGGHFKRRYLDRTSTGADELKTEPRPVKRVAGSFQEFLHEVKASKGPCYLVPENPKMPLLDAADGQTKEFHQVTIDQNHCFAIDCLRQAVKVFASERKIIVNWVVPKILFNGFKPRKLPPDLKKKVEQRVIQLSLTLCKKSKGNQVLEVKRRPARSRAEKKPSASRKATKSTKIGK